MRDDTYLSLLRHREESEHPIHHPQRQEHHMNPNIVPHLPPVRSGTTPIKILGIGTIALGLVGLGLGSASLVDGLYAAPDTHMVAADPGATYVERPLEDELRHCFSPDATAPVSVPSAPWVLSFTVSTPADAEQAGCAVGTLGGTINSGTQPEGHTTWTKDGQQYAVSWHQLPMDGIQVILTRKDTT